MLFQRLQARLEERERLKDKASITLEPTESRIDMDRYT